MIFKNKKTNYFLGMTWGVIIILNYYIFIEPELKNFLKDKQKITNIDRQIKAQRHYLKLKAHFNKELILLSAAKNYFMLESELVMRAKRAGITMQKSEIKKTELIKGLKLIHLQITWVGNYSALFKLLNSIIVNYFIIKIERLNFEMKKELTLTLSLIFYVKS